MTHEFLRDKEDIIAWLNRYGVRVYQLIKNPQYGYVVKAHSEVKIGHAQLNSIDVKFIEAKSDFICNYNNLTSLKGCPEVVEGHFFCGDNNLQNFKDCPVRIGGHFNAMRSGVKSLSYMPRYVGRDIYLGQNNIKNFDTLMLPDFVGGRIGLANEQLAEHLHHFENFEQWENAVNILKEHKKMNEIITISQASAIIHKI